MASPNYYSRYVDKLKSFQAVEGATVAILGCGHGQECAHFMREGAASITGYDLSDRIGEVFAHPNVKYLRRSVVQTGAEDSEFDIVYSAAVFEHVHDLRGAFLEAQRICKPGGLIFVISSPLWFSPYGNHMGGRLTKMPWAHLLFGPTEFEENVCAIYPDYAGDHEFIQWLVNVNFDPRYFNHLPKICYLEAVSQMKDISIISNSIWRAQLPEEILQQYMPRCINAGYIEEDLMSVAHYFVARKI